MLESSSEVILGTYAWEQCIRRIMGIVRGEPKTSTVVADALAHMAIPPRDF